MLGRCGSCAASIFTTGPTITLTLILTLIFDFVCRKSTFVNLLLSLLTIGANVISRHAPNKKT